MANHLTSGEMPGLYDLYYLICIYFFGHNAGDYILIRAKVEAA